MSLKVSVPLRTLCVGARQAAEKRSRIVILSEAKNLALRIFMNVRDSSSPTAPQNDSAHEFFRSLLSALVPGREALKLRVKELLQVVVSTGLKLSQFQRFGGSQSADKFAFGRTLACAGSASEMPYTPSSAGPDQISTQIDTLRRRQPERPP